MRKHEEELNWKGIGDYVSAARTLEEHGTGNTVGPKIHCQGLALELACKYYLWDKQGRYPGTHDLEKLAFEECEAVEFTEEQVSGIKHLNAQYVKDGEYYYPARYRPAVGRVFLSIPQGVLEQVIIKIIEHTSRPDLVDRIMAR